MAGGAISWMSKKQATVALSTAEAEYAALSTATQEAVWLRRLLGDLKVLSNSPTILMGDNQGSIAIAKNPVSHARTKHINHNICERPGLKQQQQQRQQQQQKQNNVYVDAPF